MYTVQFVTEDQAARAGLPEDVPWVMARTEDDSTYLFIRDDGVTSEVLEEAWAAFRWMALNRPAECPDVPEVVSLPEQRCARASEELRRAVIAGLVER